MEKSNSVLGEACFDKSLRAWSQRNFSVPKALRITAGSRGAVCLKQPDKWDRVWDVAGLWL